MKLYGDLNKLTLENKNYRKVILTTKQQQLVLMSLKPKEEIGLEQHNNTTQFIRVEKGTATVYLDDKKIKLKREDFIIIPPKTKHNLINTGSGDLKIYNIYSPPEHPENLVQKNKLK